MVLIPLLLVVLCFHTLTNSFAFAKNSTPLFSCNSKLFQKNTGGGVGMPFQIRAQATHDRGWSATEMRTLGGTAQRCYARSCIIFGGGFWQVHESAGKGNPGGQSRAGCGTGWREDAAAAGAAVCADACARIEDDWEGAGVDEAPDSGAHHPDAAVQPGLR